MKSILRPFSIIALLFVLYAGTCFGQSLTFCEDVDDNGNAKGEGTSFTIDRDGSYVYALVKCGWSCMTTYATFFIYSVDDDVDKTLEDSFKIETDEDWKWFSTKIDFYDEGTYDIEMADDTEFVVTSATINISYR